MPTCPCSERILWSWKGGLASWSPLSQFASSRSAPCSRPPSSCFFLLPHLVVSIFPADTSWVPWIWVSFSLERFQEQVEATKSCCLRWSKAPLEGKTRLCHLPSHGRMLKPRSTDRPSLPQLHLPLLTFKLCTECKSQVPCQAVNSKCNNLTAPASSQASRSSLALRLRSCKFGTGTKHSACRLWNRISQWAHLSLSRSFPPAPSFIADPWSLRTETASDSDASKDNTPISGGKDSYLVALTRSITSPEFLRKCQWREIESLSSRQYHRRKSEANAQCKSSASLWVPGACSAPKRIPCPYSSYIRLMRQLFAWPNSKVCQSVYFCWSQSSSSLSTYLYRFQFWSLWIA